MNQEKNARPLPPRSCDPAILGSVVEEICEQAGERARSNLRNTPYHLVPSRTALANIVETLRSVFFPGFFGSSEISDASLRFHVGATLHKVALNLHEQIEKGLSFICDRDPHGCGECAQRASEMTNTFLTRLPEVHRLLATDVQAAYEGDPAASRPDEVIICYPGMMAMTNHRLAHELYKLEIPLLPRIISELAHSTTGIDIHPGARVDEKFFIDHGTGVVIGETCIIGKRVRVYQGVTLGAKSFPLDEHGNPMKGIPRHPFVEDDVIIYGGATILGRITIGKGSTIGGNIWLTESVPPGSRVTQARARPESYHNGAGI